MGVHTTAVIPAEETTFSVLRSLGHVWDVIDAITTTSTVEGKVTEYDVEETSTVLIECFFTAMQSNASNAYGGTLLGLFRRATGGNVVQVKTSIENTKADSGFSPNIYFTPDTINNRVIINIKGLAATNIVWSFVVRYMKLA